MFHRRETEKVIVNCEVQKPKVESNISNEERNIDPKRKLAAPWKIQIVINGPPVK